MQLSPRYDGPPILRIDLPLGDVAVPLLRQRRRLAESVVGFSADEWSAASRCDGWSAHDVVAHLVGTNQFWTMSIEAGLEGRPTRFLATFDPVATPPQLVEPMKAWSSAELAERFAASNEALAAVVSRVDDATRSTCLAEAPPGLVAIEAVMLHALWDAWVHERDVLLPLGRQQPVEDDEVGACLTYVAALGPVFQATRGSIRTGSLQVEADHPHVSFVVDAGATVVVRPVAAEEPTARLAGDAVDLVDGLSFRSSRLPDVPAEHRWLLQGLDQVFDAAG